MISFEYIIRRVNERITGIPFETMINWFFWRNQLSKAIWFKFLNMYVGYKRAHGNSNEINIIQMFS